MDASGSQPGSGDASSDDAVWRDLIARYDMAVDLEAAAAPWPDIESLGTRPAGPLAPEQDRSGQEEPAQQQPEPGQDQPDQNQPGQPRRGQVPRDTGSSPASLGGATYTVGLPAVPPAGRDAEPGGSEPGAALAGPGAAPGTGSGTGSGTDCGRVRDRICGRVRNRIRSGAGKRTGTGTARLGIGPG